MGRPRRQVCAKPRKSLSGLNCVYCGEISRSVGGFEGRVAVGMRAVM